MRADYLGSTTNQARCATVSELCSGFPNAAAANAASSPAQRSAASRAQLSLISCVVGPSFSCLQIMVLSTFLPLVAGRFGLAPTSTRHTNAGVKLLPQDKAAGLYSNDPAGEPSQRRRADQRGKQLQTAPEGLWGHCVSRGRKLRCRL